MSNYDTVTLLQVQGGVRIVQVWFSGSSKVYYYYKTLENNLVYGDPVLVSHGDVEKFSLCFVVKDVTEDFMPEVGIEYRWIRQVLHIDPTDYNEQDRIARRKIQLANAIGEARSMIGMQHISDLQIPGIAPPREAEEVKWSRRVEEMQAQAEPETSLGNFDLKTPLGDNEVPF